MSVKTLHLVALAALVIGGPASTFAQTVPQNAHVILYFPHLADGGPPEQQWQTTFFFVNSHAAAVAEVELKFYSDAGSPLTLDLGSGPVSRIYFVLPPNGSQVLRSRSAAQTTITGWARATTSLPVQATLEFRTIVNGLPRLAVSAEATLSSFRHRYPVNGFTGIALANVYSDLSSSAIATLRSSQGHTVGTQTVTVPPFGHTSFVIHERFPGLGANFEGSIDLLATGIVPDFVSLALRSDSSGVISSLPPGRYKWPQPQWEQVWLAFQTTSEALRTFTAGTDLLPDLGSAPIQLVISSEEKINAFASSGSVVQINLALAELLSDSPSELASVVGHELGHIYQQRTGLSVFDPANKENDADAWGMLLAFLSGYDPYGSAGSLAKTSMALQQAELAGQYYEDLLSSDAHKSMSTRITGVYDLIKEMCGIQGVDATCNDYKRIVHPHFPDSVPLLKTNEPQKPTPEFPRLAQD